MTLPPFPTDDQTLAVLDRAVNPGHDAHRSSLLEVCRLYSQLAGSDTEAVEAVEHGVEVGRDVEYGPNDVIAALVAEIRRSRKATP